MCAIVADRRGGCVGVALRDGGKRGATAESASAPLDPPPLPTPRPCAARQGLRSGFRSLFKDKATGGGGGGGGIARVGPEATTVGRGGAERAPARIEWQPAAAAVRAAHARARARRRYG